MHLPLLLSLPSPYANPNSVTRLPEDLFDQLEEAANAHPPQRVVNPSKSWGLDFDIFDD
jgi:hypothetical protein